jgi:hypothetical protein
MKSYHPDDPKLIANWFDPHDEDHLRAWRELERLGHWPDWFWKQMQQAGVESHQGWSIMIQSRMAALWVEVHGGLRYPR